MRRRLNAEAAAAPSAADASRAADPDRVDIPLAHPVGDGVAQLQMRRPLVRDMRKAMGLAGRGAADVEVQCHMACILCGVGEALIDALEAADWNAVAAAYEGFLLRRKAPPEMRRPVLRDIRLAARAAGGRGATDGEVEFHLFANLCELAPEELDELRMADYTALQERYRDFLSPASTPGPPAPSSPGC